jgi:hypothetical protein
LPTPVSAPQTATAGERSGRLGGGRGGGGGGGGEEEAEAKAEAEAASWLAAPRGGHRLRFSSDEKNLRAAKRTEAAETALLLPFSARPRAASGPSQEEGPEEEVAVAAATKATTA